MKSVLFPLVLMFGFIISMTSCDKFDTSRDDVVRFDYKVTTDSMFRVRFSNDTIWPYETNELKDYKKERSKIEEFSVDKIDFRFYTFTKDKADNVMSGKLAIKSASGVQFQMTLSDNGVDYKDKERHEIISFNSGSMKDSTAFALLAEELVNGEYFVIESAGLTVTDTLEASVSMYVEYTIKAKL